MMSSSPKIPMAALSGGAVSVLLVMIGLLLRPH
jgi:hypothetical protein